MKCQYCNNEIPAGADKCPSCGAVAPAAPAAPAAVAPAAGAPAAGPTVVNVNLAGMPGMQQPVATKSKTVYVVLGIFFGWIGVHNFYAGRTGVGIAQFLIALLTAGLGSVITVPWMIIELITVNKDGKGAPFL